MISDATHVPETGGLMIKPKCSEDHAHGCPDDGDEHKLECKQCKKLFHYSCAGVPMFQLSHFLTTGYRKFICKQCTDVPEYLKKIMKPYLQTNSQAQEQIQKMEAELTVMKNGDGVLRGLLEERENELDKLQNESLLKDSELQREKDERKKHHTDRRRFKEKLEDTQKEMAELEIKHKNQADIIQNLRSKEKSNADSTRDKGIVDSAGDTIESKFQAFTTDIITKVTELMDKKFESINTTVTNSSEPNHPQSMVQPQERIPDAMKKAMRDAKNDDKIEESDIDRRKKNIIIHGAEEIGIDVDEIKTEDSKFVKAILQKLEVVCEPKSITRLGEPNDKKMRPIKITMKSVEDKSKVMKNLRHLKGTENEFGRLSVKDDYTNTEREEIKSWVQKAKDKSANDADRIYKVRGDPKNGLRLVSFPRQD